MRPEKYTAKTLQAFLKEDRIATLPQIKSALGTQSTMTVFRKLKGLGYLASYSHRGRYYTIRGIPRFNSLGLWMYQEAHFSKHGNLQQTAAAMVETSDAGYTVQELESLLHVDVKQALLVLTRVGRLKREMAGGRWSYFSKRRGRRVEQQRNREVILLQAPAVPTPLAAQAPKFHTGLIAFFNLLDERQRRLFAGLQSAQLGHGGDQRIATLLGLDVHTVAKGRREVLLGQSLGVRIRKRGGGRASVEKKTPTS